MLNESFETQVEAYLWGEIVRWINRLALADCEKCIHGEPPSCTHECSCIDGINFERFHLLTFFNEALLIAWDELKMEEILKNIETLIFIQLRKGYTSEEIDGINTAKNIYD